MEIIPLQSGLSLPCASDKLACAIGNFDGVHIGHKALLEIAAKKPNQTTKSAVWTFRMPSSTYLFANTKLIVAPGERFGLFREAGIDYVIQEDFEDVRNLSPDAFATHLWEDLHVRSVICGFNFRYGADAAGSAETLRAFFLAKNGTAVILPPVLVDGSPVSASRIRNAIAQGKMELAAKLLGRPYALTLPVSHGKELGRTLGFPTANQKIPTSHAIPRFGVYAVAVLADGRRYLGISDVGTRPSVENSNEIRCETYLFDFQGDLYGKTITTEFLTFLREEARFDSIDALRQAIAHDRSSAEAFFRDRNATVTP